jgi:tetratricopeptide (TPR) repeat protein
MRRFKSCLVFGSVLVFSCAAFAGDARWVEVRSPNFSVITDAGEKKGRDVALHFEQMRAVFGTLMTRANVNLSVPLQIVAFRSTKEMRQVAPIFNGKPTELAGLFQGGTDRSFIMLDMSVENPWTVVFHEYAHRLMDGNLSIRTDPWFEEGFAEYFASIEVDNKEARVGKIPEDTYQILQHMGMMKVSDLFRVQQYSKTYNESGSHRTTFYAESSLVVHYLYDNLLIPKLVVYYDTLQNQKKPVEQAIQAAFGVTPEQFDKVLRNYLNSGRFRYYPIPTPPTIVIAQFTVAPVNEADAQALVADIHAHSLDYNSRALAEFQDVLKIDPNNASALRGAGFVCMQNKDFEHAAEYLRRAAELDSKDARVHFYYAMLLNQQGPPDEAKSAEIKNQLKTSIALDPKMADAYSLLGYTQAFSGEPEQGIRTLKKAVELSPRDEHYQFNLASVYMANRKVDDAIAILNSLARSGNPEVAMHANQALSQAINFREQMKGFGSPNQVLISENGQMSAGQEATVTIEEGPEPTPAPTPAPPLFLKGRLVAVDCSAAPQAVLTVTAGSKSIQVHIRDSAHAVLIGADQFSCDWKNKNVAVNYRERPDGDGDMVSLEMQ